MEYSHGEEARRGEMERTEGGRKEESDGESKSGLERGRGPDCKERLEVTSRSDSAYRSHNQTARHGALHHLCHLQLHIHTPKRTPETEVSERVCVGVRLYRITPAL